MSDHDQLDPELTKVARQSTGTGKRELRPGDIVGGHYKIKSVVGRGGMGVVYCAEHLVIHRDCALKALAPDRVDEANWQRFQTEGKAIARLDHRNIVKVLDMGTDGPDCLFYVMDLLQGVSLAEVLQTQGVLETEAALEIFSQLCAGLGYAHKHGLIHRDVKPTNIILTRDSPGSKAPLVKIIDFGLVKLVGEAGQIKQSQTATGQICGSPLYMSPEQCMGAKIDLRSDIYSLGCTFFECLTGEPPFCGNNSLETALMHENDAPRRLADVRPDKKYPQNLEQMIDRMLRKIPAQRYQSMEQVGQDLERVRSGKSLNREAIHNSAALFELEPDEKSLSAGKNEIPKALIYCLSAFAAIVFVLGGISVCGGLSRSFGPQKEVRAGAVRAVPAIESVAGLDSLPSLKSERNVNSSRIPTADEVRIGKLFAEWPQISNGVVQENGHRVRLFRFPEVPVGVISWDPVHPVRLLARGLVRVPANQLVTLSLPRPQGLYARQFPQILTKIGPGDIFALEVTEPTDQLVGQLFLSDISPQLIQCLSKWTALRSLNFYHAALNKEATLALNQVHNIKELKLRNSEIEGDDLAQVRWLNQLEDLDLKGMTKIDPVLFRLGGSTALSKLFMDKTSPSKEALRGLIDCPNLERLSLCDSSIDDDKLALICAIPNLKSLSISRCPITAKSFAYLSNLKKMKSIDIGSVAPADLDRLKTVLPDCFIKSDPIDKYAPKYY